MWAKASENTSRIASLVVPSRQSVSNSAGPEKQEGGIEKEEEMGKWGKGNVSRCAQYSCFNVRNQPLKKCLSELMSQQADLGLKLLLLISRSLYVYRAPAFQSTLSVKEQPQRCRV
jgi:hypothetical protein